jgi:molybdopterin-guanine dinucleotide biosynthesis adapter protein
MSNAVLGVAGWKNSGKTTLVAKLVAELSGRGYRIATVKHAHHAADVDHEGTDTFRHRSAGAKEVALVTSSRWALVHELREEQEPALSEILARLSPADLVIVEGYKREVIPKIEVRRKEAAGTDLLSPGDPNVIAIACDSPVREEDRPVFGIDDIVGIADFTIRYFQLKN